MHTLACSAAERHCVAPNCELQVHVFSGCVCFTALRQLVQAIMNASADEIADALPAETARRVVADAAAPATDGAAASIAASYAVAEHAAAVEPAGDEPAQQIRAHRSRRRAELAGEPAPEASPGKHDAFKRGGAAKRGRSADGGEAAAVPDADAPDTTDPGGANGAPREAIAAADAAAGGADAAAALTAVLAASLRPYLGSLMVLEYLVLVWEVDLIARLQARKDSL